MKSFRWPGKVSCSCVCFGWFSLENRLITPGQSGRPISIFSSWRFEFSYSPFIFTPKWRLRRSKGFLTVRLSLHSNDASVAPRVFFASNHRTTSNNRMSQAVAIRSPLKIPYSQVPLSVISTTSTQNALAWWTGRKKLIPIRVAWHDDKGKWNLLEDMWKAGEW